MINYSVKKASLKTRFVDQLLFYGVGQGLFFLVLFFSKREKGPSDWIIFSWISVLVLHLSFYYLSLGIGINEVWMLPGFFFPLLYGPLTYLYIRQLINGNSLSWKNFALHLGIYFFIVILFLSLQSTRSAGLFILDGGWLYLEKGSPFLVRKFGLLMAVQPGFYAFLNLYLLQKYKDKLLAFESNLSRLSLVWLERFVYIHLVGFLILYPAIRFRKDLFPQQSFDVVYLIIAVLIVEMIYIGYHAMRQKTPEWEKDSTKTVQHKYANSSLKEADLVKIIPQLESLMKEEKSYEKADLSLRDLAQSLDISSNVLSQIINSHFQQNFYDFINQYRIEAVKEKLHDPKLEHLSILGIAFDAGFASKSAFYKAFKKYVQQSPSEYRKQKSRNASQ